MLAPHGRSEQGPCGPCDPLWVTTSKEGARHSSEGIAAAAGQAAAQPDLDAAEPGAPCALEGSVTHL